MCGENTLYTHTHACAHTPVGPDPPRAVGGRPRLLPPASGKREEINYS